MVEGGKNINWYLMLHILAPLLHASCVLACRNSNLFYKEYSFVEYSFKEIYTIYLFRFLIINILTWKGNSLEL